MCSLDGEEVPLLRPVQVTDAVESWLQQLGANMKATLKEMCATAVNSGASDIERLPSQVLCIAEVVGFTRDCEAAIGGGRAALGQLKQNLMRRLGELTSYPTDVNLTKLKVQALVLDLIHNMDVVDQLLSANTTKLDDYQWKKQLRYYITPEGQVQMKMEKATFDYTYEYQGNAPKLVHTPLTDKCYLTLTQAMHMGYGGNPYGPAGTGKTESVKALGAAFGRQVLVFNCDEGIDSKSMGRIFVGLVRCGAWGCFDEFNRLLPDQLSEISQQIQVIQAAIKHKEPQVEVPGCSPSSVDFNAGIFVTMNPAGKGYGGRSKLPDNLKALFRAVAMSKPDNEMIAEVMMYSEGFVHAKMLATKLVAVFQLSRQLLSPQQHYDWGLRALKTILRTGGQLIQDEKRKLEPGGECGQELETTVLIKALRINTLSKLTHSDTEAFNALIGDVFPGAKVTDVAYDKLEAAINEVLAEDKLEVLHLQVRKIMQFYEATQQRMGVMIVGPSGCGKSTIWKVLQKALGKLGQRIPTYVMNPKSMPREQLLGHMDMDTREWFDGVLTASARKVVRETPDVKSWIICDGDIDPEWVESLNSVLDDNRLLTMPSGERIQFGPNVNFLFETHDLKFASPATVSRMGMIFLDEESSDVRCIVSSWMRKQVSPTISHHLPPSMPFHALPCPSMPFSHLPPRCGCANSPRSSRCASRGGWTTTSSRLSTGCRCRTLASSRPPRPAWCSPRSRTFTASPQRLSSSARPCAASGAILSTPSARSSPSSSTTGRARCPPTTAGPSTASTTPRSRSNRSTPSTRPSSSLTRISPPRAGRWCAPRRCSAMSTCSCRGWSAWSRSSSSAPRGAAST